LNDNKILFNPFVYYISLKCLVNSNMVLSYLGQFCGIENKDLTIIYGWINCFGLIKGDFFV